MSHHKKGFFMTVTSLHLSAAHPQNTPTTAGCHSGLSCDGTTSLAEAGRGGYLCSAGCIQIFPPKPWYLPPHPFKHLLGDCLCHL